MKKLIVVVGVVIVSLAIAALLKDLAMGRVGAVVVGDEG